MGSQKALVNLVGGHRPEPVQRASVLGEKYRELCISFLQRCNPTMYGTSPSQCTAEQARELRDAVDGLVATSSALEEAGLLNDDTDPVQFSMEDPRNMWAYSGKLHRTSVSIPLPMLGRSVTMFQFWQKNPDYSLGGLVDGHTTGSVVWDGAVCLADFLTHSTDILLSHHPKFARDPLARSSWSWARSTVVELGAGLGLLSCTAALLGAKKVVCTDGDGSTLPMAARNAAALRASNPETSPVQVQLLQWGKCAERELGVPLPVDVVVASDVLYVLSNPGAWGALLRTLLALTGPSSVVFLTYTDRGHGRQFGKFVERAGERFHVAEVSPHLLHPTSQPTHPDRIERTSGVVQIFCLARKHDTVVAL